MKILIRKELPMKIMIRIVLTIIMIAGFFAAGFAAGFPYGRSTGFSLGSEWVMMQAEILAREQGIFMPIRYEEGQFRVLMKQPRHLYKHAWKLADRYEEKMTFADRNSNNLNAAAPLVKNIDPAEEQAPDMSGWESINALFQASHDAPLETRAVEESMVCMVKDINL
jgi:hypothetical protein